jgi:hypothetical protein
MTIALADAGTARVGLGRGGLASFADAGGAGAALKERFGVLGPFALVGFFLDLPPGDRVGEFVAAVTAGAAVREPPGRAERARIEHVVGTVRVDFPVVSALVPQVIRFVARRGRVVVGRVEHAQVRPGLVPVRPGCHRIG